MNKIYEHTQIGTLTIGGIGGALLYLLVFAVVNGPEPVVYLVLVILAIALALFATLKVTVDNDWLEIRFGIGVIRHKISIADIQSIQVAEYPWYYGWGLRLSLRGEWIYSVSGLRAVKLVVKSGVRYIIGTDDPEALASAVQRMLV